MGIGESGSFVSSSQTPDYKPNQYFTPKYFDKVLRAIESSTPRLGNGYEIHNTPRGWTIGLHSKPIGKKLRFFVITTFKENDTNYINCSIGMVNRTIPKLSGEYLDKTGTPPKMTVAEGGYVGIQVTYIPNNVFPTNATIEFRTTLTTNDTEATSFYPLAKVEILNTVAVITQLSDTNFVVNRMKIGRDVYSWSWSN